MNISGKTVLYALFADPAAHSKSPAMHTAAFDELGIDAVYLAFRVPAGRIGTAVQAVRDMGIGGFNLSMPHKQAVMEYLDEVDETASLCEAVNTVEVRDGRLIGHNTDAAGAVYALRKTGADIENGRAVILGMGGAGQAIIAGLTSAGCRRFTVALRNTDDLDKEGTRARSHKVFLDMIAEKTGAEIGIVDFSDAEGLAGEIGNAELLINATDLGMGSKAGLSPVTDISWFHSALTVMDVIYEPEETEFLRLARRAGVRSAINGLDMLLGQGAEAFRIFTGQEMPLDTVRKVLGK